MDEQERILTAMELQAKSLARIASASEKASRTLAEIWVELKKELDRDRKTL
jgi:hypothetical protein